MAKEIKKEEVGAVEEAKIEKSASFAVHNARGTYVRTYSGKDAKDNAEEYAGKIGGEAKKI